MAYNEWSIKHSPCLQNESYSILHLAFKINFVSLTLKLTTELQRVDHKIEKCS